MEKELGCILDVEKEQSPILGIVAIKKELDLGNELGYILGLEE